MSLAIIYSRASTGINAPMVTVEAHISNGLPSLSLVGLPETAVKESKDRVRSALLHTHFEFPTKRITINLAPADLPKEGARYDLPIALGILAASKQIPNASLTHYEFAGELALSGELRPIKGILPFALATRNTKRSLIVPFDNAIEANLLRDLITLPARHLLEVCAHLQGIKLLSQALPAPINISSEPELDIQEIRGQSRAKRALMIAAAGGHSLLMTGPPGGGKTMLANRLPSILPPMEEQEALDTAAITSLSEGGFAVKQWRLRPFRAPHHTASTAALIGGGNPPKPGEVSLAHRGILFLDELPEFNRRALEALREPLNSGVIKISRAKFQVEFPANFQLIAAMNPCPCGYWGDSKKHCRCTVEQIRRYQARISGPLLDRIDLSIDIPALTYHEFLEKEEESALSSTKIRTAVIAARQLQWQRNSHKINAELSNREIDRFCKLGTEEKSFLQNALQKFDLSARAYYKILKVSLTLADLGKKEKITCQQLAEALHYNQAKQAFDFAKAYDQG